MQSYPLTKQPSAIVSMIFKIFLYVSVNTLQELFDRLKEWTRNVDKYASGQREYYLQNNYI